MERDRAILIGTVGGVWFLLAGFIASFAYFNESSNGVDDNWRWIDIWNRVHFQPVL